MVNFINVYRNDLEYIKRRISLEKDRIINRSNHEPPYRLINFLISAEDHRFMYHPGFDIIAIIRAIRNNIFYNKKEGASTIEQQLVRVLINDYEKSFLRKIKEILLATSLRSLATKKDLAIIYLNLAYYGTKLDGLSAVYKKYNILNGTDISNEICAEIVSRLKYPEPKIKNLKNETSLSRRKLHLLDLYNSHSKFRILRIHV